MVTWIVRTVIRIVRIVPRQVRIVSMIIRKITGIVKIVASMVRIVRIVWKVIIIVRLVYENGKDGVLKMIILMVGIVTRRVRMDMTIIIRIFNRIF